MAHGIFLYFEDGSQEYYTDELLHSALKIAAAWRRMDTQAALSHSSGLDLKTNGT
jgi:hypothetical protein